MQARPVGIRSDTLGEHPGRQQQVLVFDVTGSSVESGTQASISIGQRSQNYETIVPNSAVRLTQTAASSSWSWQRAARSATASSQRVDVTVLAKDDVNTAVSGGISAYDMVLTTATKPVEDGCSSACPIDAYETYRHQAPARPARAEAGQS